MEVVAEAPLDVCVGHVAIDAAKLPAAFAG